MSARILLAAVLATHLVLGAETPPTPPNGPAAAPLATLPTTWRLMGNGGPLVLPGKCEVGIDATRSSGGSTLYSVLCANTALPSFGGARLGFDVAHYRGKRVRVSAALMGSGIESVANAQYPNVAGEAGLWVGVSTPQAGQRADRMQDRTLKGTTGWEVREFVVDIPEDANQLQAGFWMQGKGQVWMRDLTVEEVPTTVPVNFLLNDPKREVGPDLTLATATAPGPADRFLPPPQKWLAMGEANFALCDIGVDAQMLLAGRRNLSISCPVPVRAFLRQAFESPPFWGKRVRLSAWIKTENVEPKANGNGEPGAALYLSASDTNGPLYNVVVTGTTDWTYHELVVDIPAGAPHIPMGVSLVGTGQVWARDFKFEEVSRDTPVTALPAVNR